MHLFIAVQLCQTNFVKTIRNEIIEFMNDEQSND